MASIFGHAIATISINSFFPRELCTWKFLTLGILCSIIPDADVITFQFGIPYDHFWGHRGFTHSILFAFLFSAFLTVVFYWKAFKSPLAGLIFLFLFLSTLSHSLLDALTNGGLGIAFFSPWDNARYFFPWRPIQVSPIGASHFKGQAAYQVLRSEAVWIGIPAIALLVMSKMLRK